MNSQTFCTTPNERSKRIGPPQRSRWPSVSVTTPQGPSRAPLPSYKYEHGSPRTVREMHNGSRGDHLADAPLLARKANVAQLPSSAGMRLAVFADMGSRPCHIKLCNRHIAMTILHETVHLWLS